jgi:hypothetical protein
MGVFFMRGPARVNRFFSVDRLWFAAAVPRGNTRERMAVCKATLESETRVTT